MQQLFPPVWGISPSSFINPSQRHLPGVPRKRAVPWRCHWAKGFRTCLKAGGLYVGIMWVYPLTSHFEPFFLGVFLKGFPNGRYVGIGVHTIFFPWLKALLSRWFSKLPQVGYITSLYGTFSRMTSHMMVQWFGVVGHVCMFTKKRIDKWSCKKFKTQKD